MSLPPKKTEETEASPQERSHRSKVLGLFTLVLAALAFGWFLLWFFYLQNHATTDDAYSNGNIVTVNSIITGSVIAFYADDTDLVVEGQLLVQLNPIYYQLAYEKSLAELSSQAMQVRQFYDQVLVNQANVEIKRVALSKARFDYENRLALIGAKAISNEDFIHSRDDLTAAENEWKKAEYELQVAQDILGITPLENHPRIEEKKAEVRQAYYRLKHCSIYAPTTGYVAKRSVNVGDSITNTTDLMAIIPTNYVWVDANFKETQLKYMRVGQPATVSFDLYGSSIKYTGKVLGIASGSGSIFSLIPPQNATGNWIKIVQRLPVRISLDPEMVKKYPVRLGISAEVNVDVANLDLPMLAEAPSLKPVATTSIYVFDWEEVNAIMNGVIQMNLTQ